MRHLCAERAPVCLGATPWMYLQPHTKPFINRLGFRVWLIRRDLGFKVMDLLIEVIIDVLSRWELADSRAAWPLHGEYKL